MKSGKCSVLSVVLVLCLLFVAAAVFFPIFARPTPVRKSVCLNNIKQCGQALRLYVDDYDNQMPSSYLVSHSKTWDRADYRVFGQTLGKFPPDKKTRLVTWSQLLHGYMRKPEVMFCPSDLVDKTDPLSNTSYWYKLANDRAWYGIGCKAPRRSFNDSAFEADQIMFYERLGWHFGDESGLKDGVRINVVYMDTHVETIVISSATSGDPVNCAADSDGEPMYYNCDSKSGELGEPDKGPAKHIDPTRYYDWF